MRYIIMVIMIALIFSCSEPPTRDNPYDLAYDMPEPDSIEVEHITLTSKKISWEYELERFDDFILSRKIDENDWIEIASLNSEERSIFDSVAINKIVQYKIVAYADMNYSDEVLSDTIDNAIPAIEYLNYERLNIYTISLSWEDNNEGEDGFVIQKKINDGNWNEVATTETLTFVDVQAEVYAPLKYRVAPYSGENIADYVETEEIDTGLQAPYDLNFVIENGNVILSWVYDLEGIDGFRIEKKAYEEDWQLYVDDINADLREWTDTNSNNLDSYKMKASYQCYESDTSNEVVFREGMIFVEGGSFEMGDRFNEGSSDELPVHTVTLNSFYIGQYEVTQSEYEEVMGSNPSHSHGVGEDYPVYNVYYSDAMGYCNALSIQEGLTPCYNTTDWSCDFSADGYRLPTEAEWEYASRGGIHWEDNYRYSGTTDNLGDYAWYTSISGNLTHEVGTKLPNQLDIYDMSGNVYEWCNDWYDQDYYESSPEDNPNGPVSSYAWVRRGGCWGNDTTCCRVAHRSYNGPGYGYLSIGFRVCRNFP